MRIRVGGLYIQDNQILLVEHEKNNQRYFLLPGGGVEEGETFVQALQREFEEELSLKITVGDLLFMGEALEPGDDVNRRHVVQLIFAIDKIAGELKVNCDERLRGCRFLSLAQLDGQEFYPDCLAQLKSYVKKEHFQRYQRYVWR